MVAILSIGSIIGGATLACLAPRTRHEAQMDVVGALTVVCGLALIGASLATQVCT